MHGRLSKVAAAALRKGFSLMAVLPKPEEKENLILGVGGWYYLTLINTEKSSQGQKHFDAASTEMTQN